MNAKRHDQLKVQEVRDARDIIFTAINNEDYKNYAEKQGPLPLDQVKYAGPDMEKAVEEIDELLGWPDTNELLKIKPPKRYEDNKTFLEAFLEDSSTSNTSALTDEMLADPNVDMKMLIAALENNPAPKKKHINELKNFKHFLYLEPSTDLHAGTENYEAMYSRHPVLHRLCAIMPDLTESTRKLLLHVRDKHRLTQEHGADSAGFNKELSLGVNNDLVTAMRMIYTVAGRLLTTQDKRLQYTLATGRDASHLAEVSDAFEELTT